MQDLDGPKQGVDAQEPLRVVIVDDDALTRRTLRDVLQDAGVVVIAEAGGGREAVELTRHYWPGVVGMALVMPGVDGLEATRQIIEHAPGVRVVMLTSSDSEDVGIMTLRA